MDKKVCEKCGNTFVGDSNICNECAKTNSNILFSSNKDEISEFNKITEEEKDVDFQNSISEISNKIDLYKNRRSKLLDGYIGEFISKEEYISKKEELDKIIRKLEEDYNELKNNNGLESRTIEERIETLKEILSKNLYSEERKIEDSVISRIVSKIEVSKEKFS